MAQNRTSRRAELFEMVLALGQCEDLIRETRAGATRKPSSSRRLLRSGPAIAPRKPS